jgi:hypothetical protein
LAAAISPRLRIKALDGKTEERPLDTRSYGFLTRQNARTPSAMSQKLWIERVFAATLFPISRYTAFLTCGMAMEAV